MNKRLLIAIPTYETVQTQCFKSLWGLIRPEGVDVLLDCVSGYDVSKCRNLIAQEVFDYNFDWVLMVDSDMVLPNHTLVSLLKHDKPIIFGWYPRRCTSLRNIALQQTELFKPGMKDFTDSNNIKISELPESGLVEIKGGGMGCSLVAKEVFENTKDDRGLWFKYVQYSENSVLSEDNYFCSNVTKAGYKIYADPTVRCGHISKVVL